MKNIYLFGIIAGIFVFSTIAFAYAHSSNTTRVVNENGYYIEDEMNNMHYAMMQYIDDPELASAINEMHEDCIHAIKRNEYTALRNNMMGNQDMMDGGMM